MITHTVSARFLWLLATVTVVSADCYLQPHLALCPFHVYIAPYLSTTVQLKCSWGNIGEFREIKLGIYNKTTELLIMVRAQANSEPEFVDPSPSVKTFRPEGNLSVSGNSRQFTVTIKSVTVPDLEHLWVSKVVYSQDGQLKHEVSTAGFQAIAHPGAIGFYIRPNKNTFGSNEVINVNCKAAFALTISRDKTLTFHFQNLKPSGWADIPQYDNFQTEGFVSGAPITYKEFLIRIVTMKLRVSSILECSGRYRCYLTYQSKTIGGFSTELEVKVTPGTGFCQTDTTTTRVNPDDTRHPAGRRRRPGGGGGGIHPDADYGNNTDYYDDGDDKKDNPKTSGKDNPGLLIVTVFVGCVFVLSIAAIAVFIFRRRRRRMARRPSRAPDKIEVVMQSAMPTTSDMPSMYGMPTMSEMPTTSQSSPTSSVSSTSQSYRRSSGDTSFSQPTVTDRHDD
ncbi:hypothetical protein ACOMHN_028524 [Nucella lapillus]